MRRRTLGAVLVGVLASSLLVGSPSGAQPADFTDERVVAVGSPTAFAFLPDGRMLVTRQGGQLLLVDGGAATVALDLSSTTCDEFERGLLGVAVAPGFDEDGGDVFLYQTTGDAAPDECPFRSPTAWNRVVKVTLGPDGIGNPDSLRVLVDRIPSWGGNHNAGDVQIGPDGHLYVSVGDGGRDYAGGGSAGTNDAARDPHVLLGKVLRLTLDGGIPADNPYASSGGDCRATGRTEPGQQCRETYASGFRNPFRMAFDRDAERTRLFVNDVGQGAREEVDDVRPGADYGWNCLEGTRVNRTDGVCADPSGFSPPIHEYPSDECASITGGAFVPPATWPQEYDGTYLFADYVCGAIFVLRPGSGQAPTRLLDGLGRSSAVHLGFGPDGSLYYTTYADGGEVRRLSYVGSEANRAPTAQFTATPTAGPVPLEVTFDAGGSSDPDGDPVTFRWDFGDGATTQTTEPTVAHTYSEAGSFEATLVAADDRGGASPPAAATITPGDSAPEVTITSPAEEDRFEVGQRVELRATATDRQDGELPGEALSWRVTQHHDQHTHPYLPPTPGAEVAFTAPPPEDLAAGATSYLAVVDTATDSAGLTTTVTRRLDPARTDLRLDSDPQGVELEVAGQTFRTPARIPSWSCWGVEVSAPETVEVDGGTARFSSWSDGGAREHVVVTPWESSAITASYELPSSGASPSPSPSDGASPRPSPSNSASPSPSPSPSPQPTASPSPSGAPDVPATAVVRAGGASRIDTAVALSQQRFPGCGDDEPLAEAVVLARADGYADALAGGPLAASLGAPVLLTGSDGLDATTAQEVQRLRPERVVLLGGEAALSDSVADDVADLGIAVERVSGVDRFATSARIAALLPPSRRAYVVEGANPSPSRGWPDAVSASWLAAREGAPVLLATRDSLPDATAAALRDREVADAVIVGGEAALGSAVTEAVAATGAEVSRVGGATRYDTSRLLADRAGSLDGVTAFLATGGDFPDALAAGPSVAARAAVLLLVDGSDLAAAPASATWLEEHADELGGAVVVGGPGAVSGRVESQVAALLAGSPE